MTESMPDAVVLDGVSKHFGSKQVLSGVSFSVPRGEAVCVLGRSGTGKSVTLKLMIGLIKPDAGDIFISGYNISRLEGMELSRARCKIGFLFQSAALFDSYTLHDNLALPLRRLTDKSNSEIEEIVDRALKQVGSGRRQTQVAGRTFRWYEKARWSRAGIGTRTGSPARRRAKQRSRQDHGFGDRRSPS